MQLGLLKFSGIVKLNTCQFLYAHVYGDKSSELTLFNFSFVSEQHNYATRSSQLQHPSFDFYRINIRKFCPTIIGKYYWNIPLSIRLKSSKHSDNPFFAIILLNTSFLINPLLLLFTFLSYPLFVQLLKIDLIIVLSH